MKNYLLPSIKLTAVLIVLVSVLYPLLIAAVAKMAPGGGDGVKVERNGNVVGYANLGQKFTADEYFNSRPSAVDYNAASSGGSNKGPSNPDYLKVVADRIDTFLVHNPGVRREQIPTELVTASASGLDPHLSPAAVMIQVPRIAAVRNLPAGKITGLVNGHITRPLFGMFGPATVNVLELNLALDELK